MPAAPEADDLFDIVVRRKLHFGQTRQTGVFHMMSAPGELGRTGLTAVGNSHQEAKVTYDRAVAVLDEKTRDGAGRNDEIRMVRSESIGELTKLPGAAFGIFA